MGRVYKAQDSILQRTVALKVLHASRLNNPRTKATFYARGAGGKRAKSPKYRDDL